MENVILTEAEASMKINNSFYLDDKVRVWLKNGLCFTGTVGEVNNPDRELGLYYESSLIIMDIVTNPIVAYTVLEKN